MAGKTELVLEIIQSSFQKCEEGQAGEHTGLVYRKTQTVPMPSTSGSTIRMGEGSFLKTLESQSHKTMPKKSLLCHSKDLSNPSSSMCGVMDPPSQHGCCYCLFAYQSSNPIHATTWPQRPHCPPPSRYAVEISVLGGWICRHPTI